MPRYDLVQVATRCYLPGHMQVWTFASGSTGNCFLVESEGTRLLVECGRPLPQVLRYLDGCGLTPADLNGIVLTHAHVDHSRSALTLSDQFQMPIFASLGTLGCHSLRKTGHGQPVAADLPFQVGEILVRPFAVPHDCYEPLGFRFESASGRAVITTDLGWVPDSVAANFRDAQLLVLEANYDPRLLEEGRYPPFLKRRVASRQGHLANAEAAAAIAACGDRGPSTVWLAHISEHNNTPTHALKTIGTALRRRGLGHVPLKLTRHRKPSLYWNSAAAGQGPAPHQLTLW